MGAGFFFVLRAWPRLPLSPDARRFSLLPVLRCRWSAPLRGAPPGLRRAVVEQLGQVGTDDIVVAAVVPRTSWPCSSSTKPTVTGRASFAQANACSAATTKLITSRIAELDCSAFASTPSTYSREAFVSASAEVLCASCRSVGRRSSAGLGN